MKFQNPSLNFFLNGRTDKRTDKPKAICSPLFQSWGHNNLYPCKPQFYYIKVGCKGVYISRTCLHDESKGTFSLLKI